MNLWMIGLPIPVALAAVAVVGYLVGRSRRIPTAEQASARGELKRAKAIIRDLESIAQHVRRDLAKHHSDLVRFKERINRLNGNPGPSDWHALAEEAERLLVPTQYLATQIAHAYDGIRQQACQLTSFTEARIDPTTGVSNRRALDDSLSNLLAMHHRYGSTFSLNVFSIDHFKQLNEQHGHLHGDRIQRQVAELIDQNVRETDLVARVGGEEFMVLLPGTDLEGASVFAERVRRSIAQLVRVTVSVGVTAAAAGDDAEGLLARADQALYAAKAAGRNAVRQHTGKDVISCESDDLSETENLVEMIA